MLLQVLAALAGSQQVGRAQHAARRLKTHQCHLSFFLFLHDKENIKSFQCVWVNKVSKSEGYLFLKAQKENQIPLFTLGGIPQQLSAPLRLSPPVTGSHQLTKRFLEEAEQFPSHRACVNYTVASGQREESSFKERRREKEAERWREQVKKKEKEEEEQAAVRPLASATALPVTAQPASAALPLSPSPLSRGLQQVWLRSGLTYVERSWAHPLTQPPPHSSSSSMHALFSCSIISWKQMWSLNIALVHLCTVIISFEPFI